MTVDKLNKAATADPEVVLDSVFYSIRGHAYLELEQFKNAEEDFRTALGLAPLISEHYVDVSQALQAQKKVAEAISFLRESKNEATGAFMNGTDFDTQIARLYADQAQYLQAISAISIGLNEKPNDPEMLQLRAHWHWQSEDLAKAEIDYSASIAATPDQPFGYYLRGKFFNVGQRYDEAISDLKRAIELNAKDARFFYELGQAYGKKQERRDQIGAYRQAVRLSPKDSTYLNAAAWLLATSSDPSVLDGAESLDYAMQADKLTGGNDSNILDTLAAAYARVADFARASKMQEKAVKLLPAGPESEKTLTRFQQRLDSYRNRQAWIEK